MYTIFVAKMNRDAPCIIYPWVPKVSMELKSAFCILTLILQWQIQRGFSWKLELPLAGIHSIIDSCVILKYGGPGVQFWFICYLPHPVNWLVRFQPLIWAWLNIQWSQFATRLQPTWFPSSIVNPQNLIAMSSISNLAAVITRLKWALSTNYRSIIII